MKITIHSPKVPKRENLKKLYDVANKIFSDEKMFYTTNEVAKLKSNKNNVFLN